MNEQIKNRDLAQAEFVRIEVFNEELNKLEKLGILKLAEEQKNAINNYYENLISSLKQKFDIDLGKGQKQLSWGMKIASFFASLALAAAIFFFCYQFWGFLPIFGQIIILIISSFATTFTALYCADKGEIYFAKLLGFIAIICFILNVSLLGRMFNLTASPTIFLLAAIFALILAYATDARLLLSTAIWAWAAWLGAETGTFYGIYWLGFGEYPELFFPTALSLFLISLIPQHKYADFPKTYRIWALLFWFLPVLLLSHWGRGSLLALEYKTCEYLYQILGFLSAALLIFLGIKKDWGETVKTSVIFFTIFLYTKFFDWCWDWMPKYLFFLLIGLFSLYVLFLLRRLRSKK